jgi:tRNA splicing endonuclease
MQSLPTHLATLSPPKGIVLNGRATRDGRVFLFSPSEALLLRTKGRIAVTAIGACSAKSATNGKAAAVPILLSDEELFTCFVSGFFPLGSIKGESGNVSNVTNEASTSTTSTSAFVDAGVILARSLYAEFIEIRRREGRSEMIERSLGSLSSDNTSIDQQSTGHFPKIIPRGSLRRLVFLDLWRKGYSCTNGLKFGVDFLCYRGDPSSVHAAFIVIVAAEGEGIALLDLVARSRVATTALKVCVMAWADPEISIDDTKKEADLVGGTVRYAAFKRMGPGTAIFSDSEAMKAGAERHKQLGEEWREIV